MIKKTIKAIAFIGAFAALAFFLWMQWSQTTNPVLKLLWEPDNRPRILADLIAKNEIVDLPSEFCIADSKDIKCDSFQYSDEYAFVVASVMYPVSLHGSGTRLYTFFFNVSGKCVFHSPDDLDAWDFSRSLGDLTGDGKPEKMVKFNRYEVGEIQDRSDPLRKRFQVWRITPENSELLLYVKYSERNGKNYFDLAPKLVRMRSTSDSKVNSAGADRPQMWLVSKSEGPVVEFSWSQEHQKFETKEPIGDRWEVIYPCESKANEESDPQVP